MAKEFFKSLPDTSTPITANRLNGLLDGEEAMGNIVVDSIRSKNLFNKNAYNLFNGYAVVGTKLFTSNSNAYSIYIKIKPNTTYTVSRTQVLENNFIVVTSEEAPTNNGTLTDGQSNQTGTSITLTSGNNDNYLTIYFHYEGNSSYTISEFLDTFQIEEGDVATDKVDYIDVAPKSSYGYTYDPQTSIPITGRTRVNIAESTLKAENFICKTGRILASVIGTYKASGGVGYLALNLVNKETNETIQLGQITSTNLTTDTCNSGSRIFDVPTGTYDIYLVGYSNNDTNVLTIRAFCSLGFSVVEI